MKKNINRWLALLMALLIIVGTGIFPVSSSLSASSGETEQQEQQQEQQADQQLSEGNNNVIVPEQKVEEPEGNKQQDGQQPAGEQPAQVGQQPNGEQPNGEQPAQDGQPNGEAGGEPAAAVEGGAVDPAADSTGGSTYTVTYKASPAEGGTVDGAAEKTESVSAGANAQGATAAANDGYKFVGWVDANGTELTTADKYAPTAVSSNVTYTAVFEKTGETSGQSTAESLMKLTGDELYNALMAMKNGQGANAVGDLVDGDDELYDHVTSQLSEEQLAALFDTDDIDTANYGGRGGNGNGTNLTDMSGGNGPDGNGSNNVKTETDSKTIELTLGSTDNKSCTVTVPDGAENSMSGPNDYKNSFDTSSLNTNFATVETSGSSNGYYGQPSKGPTSAIVTAVGEGKTYFTLTYYVKTSGEGPNATYTKYVVTYNIFVNPATGISISGADSMTVGDTIALEATGNNVDLTGATITWSSSNTAIATVGEDGTVTAVANGSVTITATATLSDGTEHTATKTITVDPKAQEDGTTRVYLYVEVSSAAGKISVNGKVLTADGYNNAWYTVGYIDVPVTALEQATSKPRVDTSGKDSNGNTYSENTGTIQSYINYSNVTWWGTNQEVMQAIFSQINWNELKVCDGAENYVANGTNAWHLDGSITLANHNITLVAASAEYTYDGTEKSVSGLAESPNYTINNDGSVSFTSGGYTIKVTGYTVSGATGTDADTYTNTIDVSNISYTVYDSSGKVVSNAGTVKVYGQDGALTINPATLTVTTPSASKEYDGTALTAGGTITGLIDSDKNKVNFETTGSQTAVGSSSNTYTLTWDSTATQSNYTITESLGTLTVTEYTGQITVTTTGGTFTYDGQAHGATVSVTGLPTGYTATAKSNDTATHVAEGTVTANCDELVIKNAAGENVTSNLTITYVNGSIKINPATLTVTTPSDSKVYDGTALTKEGTISGFVNNETATFATTGTQTAVGSSNNTYTLTWNGTAVQSDYTVSENVGKLTVTEYAQEIVVTTTGGTFTYDGTAHGATVSVSTLPTGYTLEKATSNDTATHVSDGTVTANCDELVIRNAAGEDVTSELTIKYVNGSITINPATLTVTTPNASKTYDGTALTKEGTISGFVNNETATFATTGTQTAVGSSPNTYTLTWDGTAEESDYTVSATVGTLTISKADLTIKAGSAEKEYDGTALTKDTYTVTGLKGTDAISSVTVTGSQTTVGSSDNVPSNALFSSGSADNYNITYTNGTLTVTDRTEKFTVTLTATSTTATYNGQSHSATGLTNTDEDTSKDGLQVTVNNVVFTISGYTTEDPTRTDAGTYSNNISGPYVVTDADGNVVTDQFTVSTTNGKLVIDKADLTITADSAEKVYDGTALTKDTYTVTGLKGSDAISSVTVTGSQTKVGSSNNVPSNAVFSTGSADNYNITYTNGTLTVKSRNAKYEITLEANSATATYDGQSHSATGLTNTDTNTTKDGLQFKIGDVEYTISGYTTEDPTRTDAGTYTNNITGTYVVTDAAGNNVTSEFSVKPQNGKLVISPATVTVTVSGTKTYTGSSIALDIENDNYTYTALVGKDTLTASGSDLTTGTNVGSYSYTSADSTESTESTDTHYSVTITNANGDNVTENYSVTVNGTLTIVGTVTYSWSGIGENMPATLTDTTTNTTITLPTDKTDGVQNTYNNGASYTVDSTYKQGDTFVYNSKVYTFSGWKLNGTEVTGEQKMGDASVTLTGVWEQTATRVYVFLYLDPNINIPTNGNQSWIPMQVDGGRWFAVGWLDVSSDELNDSAIISKLNSGSGFTYYKTVENFHVTSSNVITWTGSLNNEVVAGLHENSSASPMTSDGGVYRFNGFVKAAEKTYTVNYYKGGELQTKDTSTKTEYTWPGHSEWTKTLSFAKADTLNANKYGSDYEITKIEKVSGGTTTEIQQSEFPKANANVPNGVVYNVYYTAKKVLTLTGASASFKYDGEAHSVSGLANEDTNAELDGLQVQIDGAEYTVSGYETSDPSATYVGEYANVVTVDEVKITDANGNDVTNRFKVVAENGKLTITDDPKDPTNVVTKTHEGVDYKAGDTVEFTITVKNIYNTEKTVTITELDGVTILVNGNTTSGTTYTTTMAAGATLTLKATYTVQQADIDAGSFTNKVKVVFTGGGSFEGTDEVDTEDKDPKLDIEKSSKLTKAEGNKTEDKAEVGDTITYTITVTNNGNTTQTNVIVEDEMLGWTTAKGTARTIDKIEVGESETLTGTYTVTQDDVDAQEDIVNTATAKSDDNTEPKPGTDPEPIPVVEPNKKLDVEKTASLAETNGDTTDNKAEAGDVITYTITVTNNGNVTLNNISVEDSMEGFAWMLAADAGTTIESLAPGASQTFTGTYTVTAADVAAQTTIYNTATATADDGTGGEDTDGGTDPVEQNYSYVIHYRNLNNGFALAADNGPFTLNITQAMPTLNAIQIAGYTYQYATVEGKATADGTVHVYFWYLPVEDADDDEPDPEVVVDTTDPNNPTLVTVDDVETPLAEGDGHSCNALPFLFLVLAGIEVAIYSKKSKKRREEINELKGVE